MLQVPKDTPQFYPCRFDGRGVTAIVSPGQANDPDSWPWMPFPVDVQCINRKINTGGPRRIDGWAPTRPYFRSVSKSTCKGRVAFAPYSFFPTFVTGLENTMAPSDYALYANKMGTYLVNMTERVAVPEGLLRQVETELLVKLADRKVHIGTALAESKKTISMISQRTLKVLGAYRALRRGRIRDAAAILGVNRGKSYHKDLSAYWLEWSYGWKPLLNDIYGASLQLKEWSTPSTSAIIRVTRQVRQYSSDPSPSGPDNRYEGGCSVRVRGLAFYKIEDEFMVQLSSLGLLNPLEIAWELTPWSFIVDWFLPVGNYLTALTAHAGTTFVDGCFSIRADGVFKCNVSDIYTSLYPGARIIEENLQVTNEAFAFERRPFHAPPSAKIYFKSPFSTNHVVSAIALLNQLKR